MDNRVHPVHNICSDEKPKTYNEDESYGAELTNHTLTQDQKAESSLLVETDESPYILDQNQLSFYFSRNIKIT